MGPTQLLPGSQYYRGDSDRQHYSRGHIPDFGEQLDGWATSVHTVVGPAGTTVIMHYDLWHRAVASASDAPRLMLKFVASRAALPLPPPAAAPPVPRWPLAAEGASLQGLHMDAMLAFLAGDSSHREMTTPARRFERQAAPVIKICIQLNRSLGNVPSQIVDLCAD